MWADTPGGGTRCTAGRVTGGGSTVPKVARLIIERPVGHQAHWEKGADPRWRHASTLLGGQVENRQGSCLPIHRTALGPQRHLPLCSGPGEASPDSAAG